MTLQSFRMKGKSITVADCLSFFLYTNVTNCVFFSILYQTLFFEFAMHFTPKRGCEKRAH